MPYWLFKSTLIERKVKKELRKFHLNFRINHSLPNKLNVDFYIPDYNFVIEACGCQVHGCQNDNCKILLDEENKKQIEKDKRKIMFLNAGYSYLILWQHEILKRGFPKRFKKLLEESFKKIKSGEKVQLII